MTVKWKVTALIAALFAILGVAEIFVAKDVLMPSFFELENKEASIAMRRVQYGMELTLDQLALTAGSWGNWTDAYRFAQDHNQAFIDEQVTPSGLKQLNLNALLFIDLAGNILASNTIELPSAKSLNLELTGECRGCRARVSGRLRCRRPDPKSRQKPSDGGRKGHGILEVDGRCGRHAGSDRHPVKGRERIEMIRAYKNEPNLTCNDTTIIHLTRLLQPTAIFGRSIGRKYSSENGDRRTKTSLAI